MHFCLHDFLISVSGCGLVYTMQRAGDETYVRQVERANMPGFIKPVLCALFI